MKKEGKIDYKTKTNISKAADITELYQALILSKNFKQRANLATTSNVVDNGIQTLLSYENKPLMTNVETVKKSDMTGGISLAAREYVILHSLRNTDVAPKLDYEFGLFGYPESFVMEKINNGTTLEEWLQAYDENPLYDEVMTQIFESITQKIETMWSKGVLHSDLHLKNIVIGTKNNLSNDSEVIIDPKIIDFGVSQINHQKFEQLSRILSVDYEAESSQECFFREVISRYDTFDEELDFLTSEIEAVVSSQNLIHMLNKLRNKLGKSQFNI